MKKFTIIFICLISFSAFSQDFIAGDTAQPGIVYNNIEDVFIWASLPGGGMGYDLFIDDTGIKIHFSVSATSSMGHTSQYSTCSVYGGQIAYLNTNAYWVHQIDEGYDLSLYNLWGNPSMLKGYFSDPEGTTYYGVFNSGYIGFNFSIQGEIYYGWVRAQVGAGSIKIYDYAYQDYNYITETGDLGKKSFVSISPNPVSQYALVEIDETIQEWAWILYDFYGNQVQLIPDILQNHIRIGRDDLKSGIYFYQVITTKGKIDTGKLIIY